MSDPQDEIEQEDFATLFAREGARQALQVGEVVKGRILQIGEETLFVDVGGKGEALIDRAELTDADGQPDRQGGRRDRGHRRPLGATRSGSRIASCRASRRGEGLAVAAETGLPVEGKVAAVIKGGYEVTVAGLRAFCPFSQMDLRRTDAPEALCRARPRVPHLALSASRAGTSWSPDGLSSRSRHARPRRKRERRSCRARCSPARWPRSPSSAPSWTWAACRAWCRPRRSRTRAWAVRPTGCTSARASP